MSRRLKVVPFARKVNWQKRLVVGRPYESVDDLVRVVGIAEESLDGLRPFVTTEGETRKRE